MEAKQQNNENYGNPRSNQEREEKGVKIRNGEENKEEEELVKLICCMIYGINNINMSVKRNYTGRKSKPLGNWSNQDCQTSAILIL